MATYDLLRDFSHSEDGVISATPSWVVAVVSFAKAITFSRDKLKELKGNAENTDVSQDMDPGENARSRGTLIISSDCIQLTSQTTKSSHTSTLSATLLKGEVNYMSEILPGDWIFAWMTNSQEDTKRIVEKIQNGQPCNTFGSGLKFVGRVQSVRESTQIERGTGHLRTRFYVQSVGFRELDSTIFFEPAFQRRFSDVGTFLGALQLAIGDFIKDHKGIDANSAIPTLFNKLMGEGVPSTFANPSQDKGITASAGLDAPYAYIIPSEVAAMLGRQAKAKSSGIAAYADIMEILIGLQRYTEQDNPEDIFTPLGTEEDSTHRKTNTPLLGTFVPQSPQFTNKTVWSILSQYLNPAINEMYTCLRATKVGDDSFIMPTIVVRQLPFNTPAFSANRSDVTPFHELPRWKVDPKLVYSYDIGRSNAMRFNLIHVYGQASMANFNNMSAAQYVLAPPVRDTLDIQRNGLFGDFMDVAIDPKDKFEGPQKWMQIRGDWQLGMHLTMNGTLQIKGIQAPICEGDNLEFNGAVYHIESVAHSCSLDESGRRSFATVLNLSHGLNANDDAVAAATKNADDTFVYITMNPSEGQALQGRVTYEGLDKVKQQEGSSDLQPVNLED
jgi:hypothetical protein